MVLECQDLSILMSGKEWKRENILFPKISLWSSQAGGVCRLPKPQEHGKEERQQRKAWAWKRKNVHSTVLYFLVLKIHFVTLMTAFSPWLGQSFSFLRGWGGFEVKAEKEYLELPLEQSWLTIFAPIPRGCDIAPLGKEYPSGESPWLLCIHTNQRCCWIWLLCYLCC